MKYNLLKLRFIVFTAVLIILSVPSAVATLTETIEDKQTLNQLYFSPFDDYGDQISLQSQTQTQEKKMKARFSSLKNSSPQSKRFSSSLLPIKEEAKED